MRFSRIKKWARWDRAALKISVEAAESPKKCVRAFVYNRCMNHATAVILSFVALIQRWSYFWTSIGLDSLYSRLISLAVSIIGKVGCLISWYDHQDYLRNGLNRIVSAEPFADSQIQQEDNPL